MNLVFASGFFIPQRVGHIAYFNGVEAHVTGKGHQALFHVVPPLGKSVVRARSLADAIQKKFPAGPIHLIAHSMGGLDSRNLIAANLNGLAAPGRIVSLTTLSTPHRGSPVADLLAGGRPGFFSFLQRSAYDAISGALGKIFDTGALGDLTTKGASEVPDVTKTHPHIRYRSYFASGRAGSRPTAVLLLPTHALISAKARGQPNDGVVALESARYGEFQQPVWPCDHVDMVGYNLDNPLQPEFKHLIEFDRIIDKLQAEHPGT